MSDLTLDVAPLPKPVNCFAWGAQSLRKDTYVNTAAAQEAGKVAKWFDHLAATCPDIVSDQPIVIQAVLRVAVHLDSRVMLKRAIAEVEEQIAAAVGSNGKPVSTSATVGIIE